MGGTKLKHPDDFLNKSVCGNCLNVMRKIPEKSVDLVVTSPPYNLKNSNGNGMKDGRGGKRSGLCFSMDILITRIVCLMMNMLNGNEKAYPKRCVS